MFRDHRHLIRRRFRISEYRKQDRRTELFRSSYRPFGKNNLFSGLRIFRRQNRRTTENARFYKSSNSRVIVESYKKNLTSQFIVRCECCELLHFNVFDASCVLYNAGGSLTSMTLVLGADGRPVAERSGSKRKPLTPRPVPASRRCPD